MRNITVTITIEGDDRAVDASLILQHIAKALASSPAITGRSVIQVSRDGSVDLNGLTVYRPRRLNAAQAARPRFNRV